MNKNRKRILISVALVALTVLACDAGTFTALLPGGAATATPTIRPTFTRRPSPTPAIEDTPTPEPSPTAAPTASPAPTQRIVPTARPATKAPAAPTPVPAPVFSWKQNPNTPQGQCPSGAGTYEVKGRVQLNGKYTGGITIIALDKTGKVIAKATSKDPIEMNPEWGVSCFEEKNMFSYQMDLSAGRNEGPFALRVVRGANDLTPLSADVRIAFDSSGGRFYIDWVSP